MIHLLTLVSTITGFVLISAFASSVGSPIGIASSHSSGQIVL